MATTFETSEQGHRALRSFRDDDTFHSGLPSPETIDAGGLDQCVEEYARLRSDGGRDRYVRSLICGARSVGCLEDIRTRAQVTQLAEYWITYFNARLAAKPV